MWDKKVMPVLDKTLGYKYFMDRTHPLADKKGRVWHHRHVASLKRGRWLTKGEQVHHIDRDRSNNSPENLEVHSHSSHAKQHVKPKKKCAICNDPMPTNRKTRKTCSMKCRHIRDGRIDWPPVHELRQEAEATSYCAVGRRLGVSDNAVRKHIKNVADGTPTRTGLFIPPL